ESKGEPQPLCQAEDSSYTSGYVGMGAKGKGITLGGFLTFFEVEAIPTHGLKRQIVHGLQAVASFKGTLERRTAKALSASLSFAGSLSRRITHGVSASLNFL